tara:strand:+ start:270 stop:542 length:273 start_codon:yes stop_codon:yes gene_type:complete
MTATDQAFETREKLAQLEEAMLNKTPNMPTLLRDIHRELKNDPDLVTILTEEECSILVNGLKQQTKTEIATKAVKKGGTKALSKMTVDDL